MPFLIRKNKGIFIQKSLTLCFGYAILQKSEEEKESRVSTLTLAQMGD